MLRGGKDSPADVFALASVTGERGIIERTPATSAGSMEKKKNLPRVRTCWCFGRKGTVGRSFIFHATEGLSESEKGLVTIPNTDPTGRGDACFELSETSSPGQKKNYQRKMYNRQLCAGVPWLGGEYSQEKNREAGTA